VVIAIVVICLGIHEAAHAWVALKRGDTTARDLGRITLNPVPHIDPFMTILLPVVTYLTVGFPFGGAKPVPVNFYNLRHPFRDMALVALAGPGSNFLLAVLFFLCQKVFVVELGWWHSYAMADNVLTWAVVLNLILAAFNLLPIPPLDGSRVMAWILPKSLRASYVQLESFGLLLVVGFIFLWREKAMLIIHDMVRVLFEGVHAIVTLGGQW